MKNKNKQYNSTLDGYDVNFCLVVFLFVLAQQSKIKSKSIKLIIFVLLLVCMPQIERMKNDKTNKKRNTNVLNVLRDIDFCVRYM